jgi:type II secretory pathway pseudopilin PulG
MVDMKITHIHSPHPHRSGFVLLEVILALALFATVAVGMTNALDQMGRANRVGRQDAQVMRVLESVLSEVAHQPELKPKTFSFPLTDDRIGASASIQKIKLITMHKSELSHMFLVRAEAWFQDGREQLMKRSMETYVYSPNSPY